MTNLPAPSRATDPPRRVRQDLDLLIVAAGDRAPTVGRVVQMTDGRWRLVVPVAGEAIEARGDRHEGSRWAARLLLRAAGSSV